MRFNLVVDDRYEDGVGDVSGTGGEHKRVSWESRVRLNNPATLDDIKEALEDQDVRVNGGK